MTGLLTLLEPAGPDASPLAHAVWRASVDGAAAILALWLLLRLMRRTPPRVECWLWRAAFGKMLVSLAWPGAITLAILPALPPWADQDAAYSAGPRHRHYHRTLPADPAAWPFLPWFIGIGAVSARTACASAAARSLRRNATATDNAPAARLLAELCRDMGIRHVPELLVSRQVDTPLLVGIARPAIVLPSGLIEHISEVELRLALSHELAHLRRHDLAWSWLSAVVGAVFFFHPFVWLTRQRLAVACESACDEAAVGLTPARIPDYLALLLRVATRSEDMQRPSFAALPIVASYHSLRHRFLAMKTTACTSPRRRLTSGIVVSVVCGLTSLPCRFSPRTAAASGPLKHTVHHTVHLVRLLHAEGAEPTMDAQ